MPGFDGRGPLGLGPISGRGEGFCALNLPTQPGEPVTGYAGKAGWPAVIPAQGPSAELAALREQVQRLEMALREFQQSLSRNKERHFIRDE
jgi:hypothetical protein